MNLCLILTVCVLATLAPPTHALLGAKLSLLGFGRNLIGGGGNGGGSGSGGGYGGYGGYGNGNYNGGYYPQQNRPVYNGGYGGGYGGSYGGGYGYGGYGRQSYAGNYNYGGYSNAGGWNSDNGGEQVVRIIKVIVPNENVATSSNYASGYTSDYSNGGWTPIPAPPRAVVQSAPAPVQTTYISASAPQPVVQVAPAPAPVQTPYYSAPAPAPQPIQYATNVAQTYEYRQSTPQSVPIQVQAPPAPAPVQVPVQSAYVSAPAPRPVVRVIPAPQPVQVYQPPSVVLQPPAPQPIAPPAQPAELVKTIKIIVDEDSNSQQGDYNGAPTQSYGPPPPPQPLPQPAPQAGWSSSSSSGGWNNGYKSGGIWEKIGC